MLIKTENFVKKLNSRLYQYTFNRKNPLDLKGSFKTAKYISDIDYTSYVYFNEKFIEILRNKLQRLKNFRFINLNAGMDENLAVPWVIDPINGCDFDMEITLRWLAKIKKRLSKETYRSIRKILKKDKLRIGDLIDIQEILSPLNTIRWDISDIMRGFKIIDGKKYNILEELKNDQEGSVLNSIYIDGQNIVSVDIGLVDKRYRHPIWNRMYKYYTSDWYKILKSYKKLISKDYEKEYYDVIKTMEYRNALKAQVDLLQTLLKYRPVSDDQIAYVAERLSKDLHTVGIGNTNLTKVSESLNEQLNAMAYPYVDYFLDKLTNSGKITAMHRLRLIVLTKDPVSKNTLISRRKNGIKCPFLPSDLVNNLASKLLYPKEKMEKCIKKVSKKENMSVEKIVTNLEKHPIQRMFLQKSNDKIKVRGVFSHKDHIFLKDQEKRPGYYLINRKDLDNMRIYMLVG
jgi:Trp operon repressor